MHCVIMLGQYPVSGRKAACALGDRRGGDRLGKTVTAYAAMHIHVQVGTLVHMQQCMGSAQSKHKLTLGQDHNVCGVG